jgi:tungstate transport system ATP-binding protein
MMELRNVAVRFGRVQALTDVSLSLQRGQCLALVGSNGSGKSTLLRVMHGLLTPSSGWREIDPSLKQAFVFQRPWMLRASCEWNVALAAWLQGATWQQARARAQAALDDAGLRELAQRPARTLSGGQQQRLAIARALVMQPDILFLDEPTASLAPQAKREVESLMAQCVERGMTLVFASHNLGQVKRLATRVICLDQGCVVADRATQAFFSEPLPTEAANFVEGEA